MKTQLDGNEILLAALKSLKIDLLSLIATTSFWASPEYCRQLERETGSSTRYPKIRRGRHYETKGDYINGIRIDDNTYANNAIKNAIGVNKNNISNFHTCHIYPNTCYKECYHTKIENLVLIPNSLAQLSDHFEDVKKILQYRSYELYGWYPQEEQKPEKPENYPTNWNEPLNVNKNVSVKEIIDQDEQITIEEKKNLFIDRENAEIEKIYQRVPGWFLKEKQQVNSIILITFLEILGENKFVSRERLMNECRSTVKDFNGNFNQMAHFGQKNHGKVFEVNNDEVRLWEPVAKFILHKYTNLIKHI